MNPAPYTLHHEPCTLNFEPWTLNPAQAEVIEEMALVPDEP